MRIGIMASELYKTIGGDDLNGLTTDQISDLTLKVLRQVKNMGLTSAEFCVGLDSVAGMIQAFRATRGLDYMLHTGETDRFSCRYPEKRAQALSNLKILIDYAAKGGVRSITIHPPLYYDPVWKYYADPHYAPRIKEALPLNEAWDVSIDLLREAARYAVRHSITLGIENMPHVCSPSQAYEGRVLKLPSFGRGPDEIMEILAAVKSDGLRITFDAGHANVVGVAPAKYVKGIVHLIVNVHVSDNDGRYDQHVPIGFGNIDFQDFFRVLVNEGYDDSIIIERHADNRLPEDVRRVKRYLSKLRVKV